MASSERVYEDFVPPHQMEGEPPATHTLTVDLAGQGYKKEHIRVQMVHNHRRLVVRGERPVDGGDGNCWSRFRLELSVPDGCDANAIHTKFDNGVVRITMPGVPPEEPVTVVDSVTGGTGKQQPQQWWSLSPIPKRASTAPAVGGVGAAEQDGGDRDRAAARAQELDKHETPPKQKARQRVVSSPAKDTGGGDDTGGVGPEKVTAASPSSSRQGYGFLHNRKTVLAVVLVLISLGIYVKYGLWP